MAPRLTPHPTPFAFSPPPPPPTPTIGRRRTHSTQTASRRTSCALSPAHALGLLGALAAFPFSLGAQNPPPAQIAQSTPPPNTPTALAPLVISATRIAQDPRTLPLTVDVFASPRLRDAPALTLDDTLRQSAAFSLFRRTGSLTANPTAQGVSLRGLGPSGASRALVLLDGIPVNDPFGGWVAWTKLPSSTVERVEIVRGGGSPAWGGASLGGVVQLLSAPLLTAPSGGRLSATAGDFFTRAATASATLATPSGHDAFRVDAAAFATDGVRLVRAPGPIDIPADSQSERGQLAWAHRLSATTTLTATARAWREERGNGTPYQRNASEEHSATATLTGAPVNHPVTAWSITVYGQDQDFSSTFSAVNTTRSAETPASDQYAVPATAAGASAQATWGDAAALADGEGGVTTLGLDARRVDGETREYFFLTAGNFTRERRAGGSQTVAGLFATHARPLAPDFTLTAGTRFDTTSRADGFRRETTRATGAVLLDEAYADRRDHSFAPSVGLAWRATRTLTARAAAYSAYRTPTLNELYRPFRVGTVTTQANPNLEAETLLGGEFGLEYRAPDASHGLRATVFQNDLTDAVANVSLSPTLRERRNLDATRVRGLELGAHWVPVPTLRLDADTLLADARVRSGGPGAAALDGKRLAQVPRITLTTGATWQAARPLSLELRARWVSAQYEDDLNTHALAPSTRLDFAAHYDFTPRLRMTVAIENLFDAETQTARTATGTVSLAPPRFARAEITYKW